MWSHMLGYEVGCGRSPSARQNTTEMLVFFTGFGWRGGMWGHPESTEARLFLSVPPLISTKSTLSHHLEGVRTIPWSYKKWYPPLSVALMICLRSSKLLRYRPRHRQGGAQWEITDATGARNIHFGWKSPNWVYLIRYCSDDSKTYQNRFLSEFYV